MVWKTEQAAGWRISRGTICSTHAPPAVGPPYLHKAHLPHRLLVVVVHLADQRVAEVHGDPLDGLVLPGWFQDLQQQLIDPAVLEFQLLWNTEVAQRQAAVPLDLEERREELS